MTFGHVREGKLAALPPGVNFCPCPTVSGPTQLLAQPIPTCWQLVGYTPCFTGVTVGAVRGACVSVLAALRAALRAVMT